MIFLIAIACIVLAIILYIWSCGRFNSVFAYSHVVTDVPPIEMDPKKRAAVLKDSRFFLRVVFCTIFYFLVKNHKGQFTPVFNFTYLLLVNSITLSYHWRNL